MATSTAGLTFTKAIIPLVSTIKEEDLIYISLSNMFVQQGNVIKHKAEVLKITSKNIEAILCMIQDFDAAVTPASLNCIQNGPKLFALFCQILSRSIWDEWDLACQGQPAMVASF